MACERARASGWFKPTRRELFKNSGERAHWKEVFRQRCRARMRDNREKVFDLLRGTSPESDKAVFTDAIVQDEFQKLQRSISPKMSRKSWWTLYGEDDDEIDDMLRIMEEIKKELREEKVEAMIARYVQEMDDEEDDLLRTDPDDLVNCPICRVNPLEKNGPMIVCKCGLSISTTYSVSMVGFRIKICVFQHEDQCNQFPAFMVCPQEDSGLIMVCHACSYMGTII